MGLHFFPEPAPEEREIRATARTLTQMMVRPYAIEDDRTSTFRRQAFQELAKAGLAGIAIPKKYGGLGLGYRAHYAALEEITRGSASMTVVVGVTNLVQGAILQLGNQRQKEEFLPKLARGELLGAFSLSEPQSGSDAAGLRCRAKRVPGGYRVTGTKAWCSNGGVADVYLLMARTSDHKTKGITAFLVMKDAPGFRVGKAEAKLGLRGSTLTELIFEDCFLSDSQRIAEEGEGMKVALSQLDAGRITIGVTGLGLTIEALEKTFQCRHDHPELDDGAEEGVRSLMADHYANAQAVSGMVGTAADMRQAGVPFTVVASQVKLLGSDLALRATSDSVTWLGTAGALRATGVERLLRDAKALQIVEGTNQIQRLVLSREMERMMTGSLA